MNPNHIIVGIDPGRTTGICQLVPILRVGGAFDRWNVELAQVSSGLVLPLVTGILDECPADWPIHLAVEAFVEGRHAGRGTDAAATKIARDIISELQGLVLPNVRVFVRPAGTVKPWATDARLLKANIWQTGMRHAMDGGRHALFHAHRIGYPDPLSHKTLVMPDLQTRSRHQ